MPELTRYGFRDALSGFFEIPTEVARRVLPGHLEPVESHHGSSVFSVTAFDFVESEVGSYGEIVLGFVVAPLVKPGERLPKSAMYPFQIGTTTAAARRHAIERWHLPHWMDDVQMHWERGGDQIAVHVAGEGAPILDITVTLHSWDRVSHLYQCFMKDGEGAYMAQMTLEGAQSEHEDERGALRLHDHPFNREVLSADVPEAPFREIWMREGMQTFQPLVQLETA